MNKSVFLIDRDELTENIQELLQLEGIAVRIITANKAKRVFQNYQPGIVVFNKLTLNEPAVDFINMLSHKTDGIVVLCSDKDDPELESADARILLPFGQQQLSEKVSQLM